MNKKDFDLINKKFSKARITVPSDLDSKVLPRLDSAKPKRISFFDTNSFRAGLSFVACVAIFACVMTVLRLPNIKMATDKNGITTFSDYASVKEYLTSSQKPTFFDTVKDIDMDGFMFRKYSMAIAEENMDEASSDINDSYSSTTSDNDSYAKTYIQEKGVDEPDIIKTYNDLIFYTVLPKSDEYYSPVSHKKIEIVRAEHGKTEKIATVNIDDKDANIADFYVTQNRLIVNTNCVNYQFIYDGPAEYDCLYTSEDSVAKSIIYDISNPAKPKLLDTYEQTGCYVSSRLVGDIEYIVTSYQIYDTVDVDKNDKEKYIPKCGTEDDCAFVRADSIAFNPNINATSYTVVSAVNVDKACKLGEPKAVLGNGDDIYCTTNTLYVYGNDYSKNEIKTVITKISLDKGVSFVATAKVDGYADSSYSFYEKDGNLLLCLTLSNNGKESNIMCVLDGKLKQITKTDAFAKDESIKAVKYIGDYAYVITYEQTDPLFVIDISNTKSPKIKGEVKISGFSTMLVNLPDDMLLGIGYCTSEVDYTDMQVTDGVKFALFDVSNPESPKVLDSKEYKNICSAAQSNPKAFVQNLEKGYYAIPVNSYDDSKCGAIIVSVEDGKIKEKQVKYISNTENDDCRVTYIDNYYYIVTSYGDIESFEME